MQSAACVIPAYNAAITVSSVVAGLRASVPGASIIGIDDGSADGTRGILNDVCDRAIGFDRNCGKGAALRAGFERALDDDRDAVLTVDADGQHDPSFAAVLLAGLADADIVVGARARLGDMPIRRRVTNALSAAAASHLARCTVADAQSGFRAISARVLRAVHARGDRYEFETDFLIRAARGGFRIASVQVPTLYGPPSHFRDVRDGMRVVGTFFRHAVGGAS